MVLQDESNAPKSITQLRHLKFRNEKKKNPNKPKNVADEIQEVERMLDDNDFVRKMEKSKGKSPSIILYSEEQMIAFKNFTETCEEPRVGIDRTFNLGSFFVTSFNYKSVKVIRKETGEKAIFLGPIFLHRDANFETYHYFLSQVRASLSEDIKHVDVLLPPEVQIGSDDEKAITKAIDAVFPQVNTWN